MAPQPRHRVGGRSGVSLGEQPRRASVVGVAHTRQVGQRSSVRRHPDIAEPDEVSAVDLEVTVDQSPVGHPVQAPWDRPLHRVA